MILDTYIAQIKSEKDWDDLLGACNWFSLICPACGIKIKSFPFLWVDYHGLNESKFVFIHQACRSDYELREKHIHFNFN